MNEEFTLTLDNPSNFELELIGNEQELVLQSEVPMLDDYNLLRNKPTINGVILQGNLSLADLFSGGLIIDGGSAEAVI